MSLRLLLWKDLRRELRSKEGLQAGLVLVGLFFILHLFSFDDLSNAPAVAAIVVWTPMVYAAAAVTGRGFAHDLEATPDLLATAPVPLALHGISRTLVHLLLLLVLAVGSLGLASLTFQIPFTSGVALPVLLGAVGLAVTGTLAGALAAQARSRDILLPVLLLPVVAPLVQAGLTATQAALAGSTERVPLLLAAGYDLVATGVAWILWPFALEAD